MNTCIHCGKRNYWIDGDYCEVCRFAMGQWDADPTEYANENQELSFQRYLLRERNRKRR